MQTKDRPLEDVLMERLRESVTSADLAQLTPEGVDRVVAAFTALLPRTSRAADVVGPVYDAASLALWLKVSRQALHGRVSRGRILALTTDETPRRTMFPTWQFDAQGQVIAGVAETLAALAPAGWDDLTTALWFCGPSPRLEGMSAAQWLADSHPIEPVLQAARSAVAKWTQDADAPQRQAGSTRDLLTSGGKARR